MAVPPVRIVQGQPCRTTAWVTNTVTEKNIAGRPVNFHIDGALMGTVTTDSAGLALFSYGTANLPLGTVHVIATFAGNSQYGPSTSYDASYMLVTTLNPTSTPTLAP